MKKLTLLALVASLAVGSSSALLAAEENADSLPQILKTAEASKKPVVLEFTGSDWCPPCKMMQKQVFSTPDFQKFAASDIVFVKLDFPRQRDQDAAVKARNRELAEKFNVEGFPTVIVLDAAGKELSRKVGFGAGGPEAFIDWVKKSAKL